MTISILMVIGMTLTSSTPPDLTAEVENVARLVADGYVDSATGQRMAASLREKMRKGEYAKLKRGEDLAERLTADLRAVYNDRHLRVLYSERPLPPDPPFMQGPTPEMLANIEARFGPENYGLTKAEVLKGNIGYLNFKAFLPLALAKDTYAAGMRMVANVDALVIDLRECGGSMDPEAIPFVLGYLFDKPTHLGDIDWKFDGKTMSFYTAADVPGKRLARQPVYVLTSRRTFSGGEGLAYDLQALKRATIVGGQTGGGANPGGTRRASDHFAVWLPVGKVRNAVTGGNWEGVGVTPDVRVPATRALFEAQRLALRKLKEETKDAMLRQRYEEAERILLDDALPLRKVKFTLSGYPTATSVSVAGTFNSFVPESDVLRREGDRWVGYAEVEPGYHRYKFVVDGKWIADPANPEKVGSHGDSRLVVR